MPPIKVLVVDDSAVMRQILPEILRQDSEINVVGTATGSLYRVGKDQDAAA